jgi:hypothetical protein
VHHREATALQPTAHIDDPGALSEPAGPAFATPSAYAKDMQRKDKLGKFEIQGLMSDYSEASTCQTIDLGIFGRFTVCS